MFWKFVISYGRYRFTPTYTFGGGLLRHCTHGALNNLGLALDKSGTLECDAPSPKQLRNWRVSMSKELTLTYVTGQQENWWRGTCQCGKTWNLPSVEAIKFQHGHHAGVWDEEVTLLW